MIVIELRVGRRQYSDFDLGRMHQRLRDLKLPDALISADFKNGWGKEVFIGNGDQHLPFETSSMILNAIEGTKRKRKGRTSDLEIDKKSRKRR